MEAYTGKTTVPTKHQLDNDRCVFPLELMCKLPPLPCDGRLASITADTPVIYRITDSVNKKTYLITHRVDIPNEKHVVLFAGVTVRPCLVIDMTEQMFDGDRVVRVTDEAVATYFPINMFVGVPIYGTDNKMHVGQIFDHGYHNQRRKTLGELHCAPCNNREKR